MVSKLWNDKGEITKNKERKRKFLDFFNNYSQAM